MRVIAGIARSIPLITPAGDTTRPTSDRIKETLFNIISPYLYDAAFLDLFCGSGGIGIEAISRGAAKACFVDNNRKALDCLHKNIEKTKFTDKATVLEGDALSAISKLGLRAESFDIIFLDPPYQEGYYEKVLLLLAGSPILRPDTMIIAEAPIDYDFSFAQSMGLSITREKEYKTNKHVFLKRA